jgi:hypothetical protein
MSDDDTALWLVFTKPVEGMEDEYDTWYDEVHLPDVVAVSGVRSAQRFVIGPERRPVAEEPAFRNLTVYELEGEPELVFKETTRRIDAGEMVLSPALDRTATAQSVWRPRGPKLT